jgi:hypothetical protein
VFSFLAGDVRLSGEDVFGEEEKDFTPDLEDGDPEETDRSEDGLSERILRGEEETVCPGFRAGRPSPPEEGEAETLRPVPRLPGEAFRLVVTPRESGALLSLSIEELRLIRDGESPPEATALLPNCLTCG